MGEVYRAHDTRLDRDVAIKVLPDSAVFDQPSIDRFYREGRAASALNHPNICVIHDMGEAPVPFIVFELLEGETLKDRLGRGPLPPNEAIAYAIQIADALEAAHEKGIIHRDIKPANVFITSRSRAKILDFGLAKVRHQLVSHQSDPAGETVLADLLLTTPGTALGTVAYMSPEQVRGEDLDQRSDLFSLGVTLYEMLTGRLPFPGPTVGIVFDQILHGKPAPLSSVPPAASPEIAAVVLRTLERNRRRRYQSAKDLRVALEAVRDPGPPLTARTPPARRVSSSIPTRPRGRSSARLAARSRAIDSLAVLPFANQSGDADQEYLADGLTEAIIYKLSRLQGLRVIPRSSVFRYKGRDIDPVVAARES
jgi:serine/threonine protein kinase